MGATSLTELSTLPDNLSSSPVYRRVHVADFSVVCVSLFVLFFSWPLYFQPFLFLLVIVFSALPFSLGHCIFSPSFFSWTLYFQPFLFLLVIVFSVLPFSLGHCIFSPSFFSWTLYFQSFLFLLAIAFSVLPFSLGHCIFSPSFFSWPLYFQSFLFLLAIVFSVLPFDTPVTRRSVLCDWVWRAGGRPHRFPYNNFTSVYRIVTKLSHMIPGRRGRTFFILGSLGQRSRSPLL